jgi:hypothetical protein
MGDLSTAKVINDGQLGVDGHDLMQLVTMGVINPDFVSAKTQANAPANTDQLLMLRQDNTYARILYNALFNQDVIRKAIGPIGAVGTLINGDMAIWQRNTSFANIANAAYCADRWRADYVMATGKISVTQVDLSGSLPGSATTHQPRYCLRATVATQQASLLAGEFFTISQRVEKQRARMLFDNVHSLSIWLRSSVAGTFSVSLRNADTSQFYKTDVSIATPNVWQRVTIQNIPAFPTGSGSWGTNETDLCYSVSVCLAAGTTFQSATQNAWAAGNMLATSSQTNLLATSSATFDVCLVQHEPGSVSSAFVPAGEDEVLWECQRYYAKSLNRSVYPGSVQNNGNPSFIATSTAGAVGWSPFPNKMRTGSPTVSLYVPSSGAAGAAGITSGVAGGIGESGFGIVTGSGATTGQAVSFHYTADGEL